jgi:lambda repressor-like predicted transcriptional regulator
LAVEQIQSYILAVIGSSIENDLAESQRAALIAIYQQGLSDRESARQLGISPNKLDKLLAGIRKLIRRLINEKLNLSVHEVITFFKWPYQNPEGVHNQHLENKMKREQQIQSDR